MGDESPYSHQSVRARPPRPMSREAADRLRDRGDHYMARYRESFRVRATTVFALGWAPIPQTYDWDGRRVGSDDGFEPIEWSRYRDGLTLKDVVRWQQWNWDHNLALMLSASTFALDLDVDDKAVAKAIEALADEHLGPTITRRHRGSRSMRIYGRVEGSIGPGKVKLLGYAGEVAVLAGGQLVTAYGQHHQTGRLFAWDEDSGPHNTAPSSLPVVGQEQVTAFLTAVQQSFGEPMAARVAAPARAAGSNAPRRVADQIEGVWLIHPGECRDPLRATWTLDAAGRVTQGGEEFCWTLCALAVRANRRVAEEPGGLERIRDAALEQFAAWSVGYVGAGGGDGPRRRRWDQECAGKVRRAAEAAAAGRQGREWIDNPGAYAARIGTRAVVSGSAERVEAAPANVVTLVPAAPAAFPIGDVPRGLRRTGELPAKVKLLTTTVDLISLQVPLTVDAVAARLKRETTKAVRNYASVIAEWIVAGQPSDAEILHLIRCVAGGGKTSTTVEILAALSMWVRETLKEALRCGMVVPTHDLAQQIAEAARRRGLNVVVWEGRARGCHRAAEMQRLQAADISTQGMCGHRTSAGFYVPCPSARQCTVQRQADDVGDADLVLIPRAYLTVSKLPEALEEAVRFVVVDEEVWSSTCKSAALPLADILAASRSAVRRRDSDALLAARDLALDVLADALREDADVAEAFRRRPDGAAIVNAALTVCRHGDKASAAVTPGIDAAGIERLIERQDGVGFERRLWTLVADGLRRGGPDRRVRLVRDAGVDTIRLSWLAEMHLVGDRPCLMLDASADKALVECVLGRRVTSYTEIEAPLRQNTTLIYERASKSALLPRPGDGRKEKAEKAARLARIADAVAVTALRYAPDRVLVAAPLAVLDALRALRSFGPNIVFAHYGSLRGSNAFSDVAAVVRIGSNRAAPIQIDDLAVALSHAAGVEETLTVDRHGKEQPPVFVSRPIQMRDGRQVSTSVAATVGRWHRAVVAQITDEDALQTEARSRQVYRDQPVHLIVVDTQIPAGAICDDVVTLADYVGGAVEVEVADRLAGGTEVALSDTAWTPEARQEITRGYAVVSWGRGESRLSEWLYAATDGGGTVLRWPQREAEPEKPPARLRVVG